MTSKAFKITALVVPTLSIGVAGLVAVLPNTLWLNEMKAIVHSYNKNGSPVPISPDIHELFLEVKSDLINAKNLDSYNITTEKLNRIKPFTIFGFDLYRLGWLEYDFEAAVGVPEYFTNDNELTRHGIRVDKQVDWDSEAGEKLKESMQNTNDAKKFAIAREMLHLCQDDVTLNACINGWNVFLGTGLAFGLTDTLKLKGRPMPLRVMVYTLVVATTATLYIFLTDVTTSCREKEADKSLCELGMKYSMGGTEYYYNVIRRNMSLRDLAGAQGERTYTAYGNEKALIRQKHLPVVERAEFCRKCLQDYIDEKESSNE